MEEPAIRLGLGPSFRQATIQTGASWKWSVRYSTALCWRVYFSPVTPGGGALLAYRGPTTSSNAFLYQTWTAFLIAGSLTTRKRQVWLLPPFAAAVPAIRIFLIISSGTGSGFSRRIERVVPM